jgi:hypothetical protein
MFMDMGMSCDSCADCSAFHSPLSRKFDPHVFATIRAGVIMTIVENVKEVADLVKKYNDIDLNRRILNLENEVLDLTRDKRRADNKIEELEEALKFKEKLTYKTPFFWLEGEAEPYCSPCWSTKRQAVHVIEAAVAGSKRTEKMCPSCKTIYPWGSY